MTSNELIKSGDVVNVSIQYEDIRVQFSGEPENVLSSVIAFLSKHVPELSLAKKISLNYSVSELIDLYSPLLKITPEGLRILPELELQNKKFSDKETVMLYLLGSKIAFDLGKMPERSSSISEIQSSTNLNPKSISSRLSELVKAGYVAKNSNKDAQTDSVVYDITTTGISWLNNIMTKKLNSK